MMIRIFELFQSLTLLLGCVVAGHPGRWGIECLSLYPVVSETHFSSEILLDGGGRVRLHSRCWGMVGKFSLALCFCDQGEDLSDLGRTSQWTLFVISPESCSLGPLM